MGTMETPWLLYKNSMNVYETIISLSNIEAAYFEVVAKFEEMSRSHRYRGIDGMTLSDYDFTSLSLFQDIHDELTEGRPIDPSLEAHIPKRNKPGTRPVYVHTIKERVKSQAVYRVVEPVFNAYFSEYLFSYRTTHPHYKALKSVVKRYRNNQEGYLLLGDISSYSDIINPNILKEKIVDVGFDERTNQLLFLYVDMLYLSKGKIRSSEEGIITGLPVTVMFNNLYLDSFDKQFGNELSLYRRVGDDFIAFDTEEILTDTLQEMSEMLVDHLIDIDHQKMKIQKVSDPFTFLGYLFEKGTISIPPQSQKNIEKRIRYDLRFRFFRSQKDRIKKLHQILYTGTSLHHYFVQIIRQYNHVDNMGQIQSLSDYFYKRLVIYFFGSYSERNHRRTKEFTKNMNLPSFIQYYISFHKGEGDEFFKKQWT